MQDDPQRTTRDAHGDAVRRLGRRPYTRHELREWLLAREHDEREVDEAIERCAARRWLDDATLAHDYVVARAARIGHGPRRLIDDLRRRGVDESVADAAWRGALDAGEVDPAAMLARRVRRRVAGRGRLAPRAWARVYSALLGEGFERDDVERALRPHAATASTGDDAPRYDGHDDDLA